MNIYIYMYIYIYILNKNKSWILTNLCLDRTPKQRVKERPIKKLFFNIKKHVDIIIKIKLYKNMR
jgi:hypothetical protein